MSSPSDPTMPPQAPPRGSNARFGLCLAAVALLVLVVGVDFMLSHRDQGFSSGGLAPLAPLGAVEDFERFAWSDQRAGGRYRLSLRELEPPGAIVHVEEDLTELGWSPEQALRAQLPDRLEWKVEALEEVDAAGRAAGGRAWRSSP